MIDFSLEKIIYQYQ